MITKKVYALEPNMSHWLGFVKGDWVRVGFSKLGYGRIEVALGRTG